LLFLSFKIIGSLCMEGGMMTAFLRMSSAP
jgi:hypothetical protein